MQVQVEVERAVKVMEERTGRISITQVRKVVTLGEVKTSSLITKTTHMREATIKDEKEGSRSLIAFYNKRTDIVMHMFQMKESK